MRIQLLIAAFVLSTLALTGCEKKSPIEQAQEAVDTDPDKAISLCNDILAKAPDDYMAILTMGQAYEAKGDLATAVDWYQKSLDHEEGAKQSKLLTDKVYNIQLDLIQKATDDTKRLDLLQKAAKLEEKLKIRNIVANKQLFERYSSQFETADKSDDYDTAIELAESIGDLYFDAKKKKKFTSQIDDLKDRKFKSLLKKSFEDKVKPKLLKDKVYDEGKKMIALVNTFEVPDEDEWDETAEGFEEKVKDTTCGPLITGLAAILNEIAKESPLGRALEAKETGLLNQDIISRMVTGWTTEGYETGMKRKKKQVIEYQCELSLPFDTVVERYLTIHQAAEAAKKAAEEAKDEKKGDAKKDEKKADEKKADEKKGDVKKDEKKADEGKADEEKDDAKKDEKADPAK